MSAPDGPSAGVPSQAASTPPRDAREMLDRGRAFLRRQGLEEARLEAELLVAHALGLQRLELFLRLDQPVQPDEVVRGRELLVRRAKGEPTAYLLGEREFYGRGFRVNPAVLIPRPETELLVDRAREWAADRLFPAGGPRVFDLGTGSGCLAVTLALELPGASVEASDVSAEALEVARENAARLGADVLFHQADGEAPLLERRGPKGFDLVVSNPPYVAPDAELAREVRDHEPHLALFAPAEDLDHWALRLLRVAPTVLSPGGVLLVELGFDQAERLRKRLDDGGFAGLDEVLFHRDLGGHSRVLEARLAE